MQDIALLSEWVDYDLTKGIINGFEAGVNLNLVGLPQLYLSPNYLIPRFICYQVRAPFTPMKTIRGAGQGVECLSDKLSYQTI